MAVFWDLDNLRPPAGYETVWAYRLVEAAFEYAEIAHVRAYAREGTVDEDTQRALRDVGVTFTECPRVAEGADVRLATDVVNFVRGGGVLPEDAEKPPNPAADAVARADAFAVLVASRDEGLASCVEFARSRRDACVGAMVAGEFLAKAAHRPQFAGAMRQDGDVGVTPGYWRVLCHVAGKSNKGPMGKSKLVRAADATALWDSKRAFELPGADVDRDQTDDVQGREVEGETEGEGEEEEGEEMGDGGEMRADGEMTFEDGDWEVGSLDDVVAAPGGFSALWIDGALAPWPPGAPIPE